MSDSPASELPADQAAGHHHPQAGVIGLAVGAIGIVFGDIGTSPIYAFRETFKGHHHLEQGDPEKLRLIFNIRVVDEAPVRLDQPGSAP